MPMVVRNGAVTADTTVEDTAVEGHTAAAEDTTVAALMAAHTVAGMAAHTVAGMPVVDMRRQHMAAVDMLRQRTVAAADMPQRGTAVADTNIANR